ncbi:MAG: DUF1538 domain-containing protein [bacterium]|jgi:hypothetical protein
MLVLAEKLKEVLSAVLPITVIVLVLNFTMVPLEFPLLLRFLLGAVLIIGGLAIFLFGVDIGVTPIGNLMGTTIAKTNKIWLVGVAGFILGFIISIAEPDLHILAGQVDSVTSGLIGKFSLVAIVSVGIGVLLALGLLRIVNNIALGKTFTVLYVIIFGLALFTSPEFIAIAFDASGATTGALTVPFILALGAGVSRLKKDSEASEEDSFGLLGLASAGVIMAVLLTGIAARNVKVTGNLEHNITATASVLAPFLQQLPGIAREALYALLPLVAIFFVFQKISFKLSKKAAMRIGKGLLYTFIGLVLFLTGANVGFMEVGSTVGYSLAALENKFYVVIVGFVLGLVTILAEPAVYVLTHQIEDVTSGSVKRKLVLFALALGVGSAVALALLRIIIPGIQLWHYLLPGYIIALGMTFFVPPLFVGIAFDSGGVASGPMTATFILAFSQGVAEAVAGADVLLDGFGTIAMVALTPLIALQVLGLIFKVKTVKGGIEADGE